MARQPRKDKGKNYAVIVELRPLIEGLYLQASHRSFASVYRQIKKYQHNQQLPYPNTECLRHIKSAAEIHDDFSSSRSQAYRQKFDLLHRHEASQPNEIWQADHVELDIRSRIYKVNQVDRG